MARTRRSRSGVVVKRKQRCLAWAYGVGGLGEFGRVVRGAAGCVHHGLHRTDGVPQVCPANVCRPCAGRFPALQSAWVLSLRCQPAVVCCRRP